MKDAVDQFEYSLLGLDLKQAAAAQNLLAQLQQESDTFELAEVRDTLVKDEEGPTLTDLAGQSLPQKTWLLWAQSVASDLSNLAQPIGIGSIVAGEIGLAILADFQGRGLGQSTLAAMIDWAKEVGYDRLWLDVDQENQVARHLYQKAAFVPVGQDPVPIRLRSGRQANLIQMELIF